jgi:hypothetical protein
MLLQLQNAATTTNMAHDPGNGHTWDQVVMSCAIVDEILNVVYFSE